MSFADQMEVANQAVLKEVIQGRNSIFRNVADEIIQRTPVETGALKGAWTASQGTPSVALPLRFDEDGAAPMAEVDEVLSVLPPTSSMFLTNNQPYAAEIEYGGKSREKAPQGMVRVTIERYATGGGDNGSY